MGPGTMTHAVLGIAGLVMVMMALTLTVMLSISVTSSDSGAGDSHTFDFVVYGATPSGIAAALAAVDTAKGTRVAVVEPTDSIGGVTTQGIGLRDFCYELTMRSTMREWGMLNAEHYNVEAPVWQPDNHVGEASYAKLLASRGVHVFMERRIVQSANGVRKAKTDSRRIGAFQTLHEDEHNKSVAEWWTAAYFLDATYEGDLLRFAGASYTVGREAKDQFHEPMAGVTSSSLGNFDVDVDPIGPDGELLPYVNGFGAGTTGAADDGIMAYSMRVCVTNNPEKQAPFRPPQGYNASDFELLARYYRAGGKGTPYAPLPFRNYPDKDKFDICDDGERMPMSTDAAGLGVGYPTGTHAERAEIARKHQYYISGMFWFLLTDPSVPPEIQERTKRLGLCRDEWPDNGHWPKMYVREGIRLVSDKVFNQVDCDAASRYPLASSETGRKGNFSLQAPGSVPCHEDSIGLGGWGYDIHIIRRYARKVNSGYKAWNEGQTAAYGPRGMPGLFELPRSLITPKRAELSNLLVSTCVASSHVVFSAIREEPSLWQMGQAAGTIVSLALGMQSSVNASTLIPVTSVPDAHLQAALIRQGNAVHWPARLECATSNSSLQERSELA